MLRTIMHSNIVSTVKMSKKINLPDVVDKLRNTEYNPKVSVSAVEIMV